MDYAVREKSFKSPFRDSFAVGLFLFLARVHAGRGSGGHVREGNHGLHLGSDGVVPREDLDSFRGLNVVCNVLGDI